MKKFKITMSIEDNFFTNIYSANSEQEAIELAFAEGLLKCEKNDSEIEIVDIIETEF